ncbi:MAG: hypothetical protein ACREER_02775 [Alphaproteobacteria bacterium]
MSTPVATHETQGVADRDPQRPYADYPAVRLCEMLERQYDQGQPFDELIVFELANRALAAEGALAS